MKKLLILLLLPLSGIIYAQDFETYNVTNIPPELKEHADLIIRNYKMQFDILPSFNLRQTIYEVKTIMNKSAEGEADLVIYYDKFRRVKKFTATTLDKNGEVVKKLKKADVIDVSIAQNSVDDSRVKVAEMAHTEYPYTVVFDYEMDYDGRFYYPQFMPQSEERVAVQNSSFSINFPEGLKPRFKELNIKFTKETTTSLAWEVNNLTAFEDIPYSPEITDFVPMVITAPAEFELDGNKGDMTTWAGFANWYDVLNNDRDLLLDEDIQNAQNLTKNLSTTEEKIKAIYEYMQSKTRYVSVQLGIGGYQTMLATDVAEDGWGDCKALSNYTKALLKSAGISAYPALVYAGRGAPNIIKEFSSNQFNHVILCVPLEQDTVWLECTSREVPYNFLGNFTGDRDVLFVKNAQQGGEIIRTPRYLADENYEFRRADVVLDKEGNGTAKVKTNYGGLSFDRLIPYFDESEEKLKKYWYEKIKIPGYKIEHIGFDYDKSVGPKADQELELTLKNYASKSGNRFFFKPNLMNRNTYYPKAKEGRQLDVVTTTEYLDIDTVTFTLPEGMHPEHLPESVYLESPFGTYSSTYKMNEDGFMYIRKMKRVKGRFPKESFNELSDFLKKIKKADNNKVVLMGST